jgi:hypothetical protein
MKLVSREVVFDIDTISKTNVLKDDVIVITADLMKLPAAKAKEWSDAIKAGFQQVFPNNKVVVLDKSVTINIVTITP